MELRAFEPFLAKPRIWDDQPCSPSIQGVGWLAPDVNLAVCTRILFGWVGGLGVWSVGGVKTLSSRWVDHRFVTGSLRHLCPPAHVLARWMGEAGSETNAHRLL